MCKDKDKKWATRWSLFKTLWKREHKTETHKQLWAKYELMLGYRSMMGLVNGFV